MSEENSSGPMSESIRLNVLAPEVSMPGLDSALLKLSGINAYLDKINAHSTFLTKQATSAKSAFSETLKKAKESTFDRTSAGGASEISRLTRFNEKSEVLYEKIIHSEDAFQQKLTATIITGGKQRTEELEKSAQARLRIIRDEVQQQTAGNRGGLRKELESAAGNVAKTKQAEADYHERQASAITSVADARRADLDASGMQLTHSTLMAQAAQHELQATKGKVAAAKALKRESEQAAEAERKASVEQATRNNRAVKLKRDRTSDREQSATDSDVEAATRSNEARRLLRKREEKSQKSKKQIEREQKTQLRSDIQTDLAYREAELRRGVEERIASETGDPRQVKIARQREEANFQKQMSALQKSQSSRALQGGDRNLASQLMKASEASFGSYNRALESAREAQLRFDESTRLIGKNMLDNVKHVTTWAASVGVLYGTLDLARSGMEAMISTGLQSARLSQVFGGNAAEAVRLTDSVMRLASANGVATSAAMESSIAWARMGLSRVQVEEAVRVSLVASNVAEITAAEATEHLSSAVSVWHLEARQLKGVLGELNAISNVYNVTVNDMLVGLSKTSSVAKEAGLSLSETMGLIGAGVGATGQSGANLGNAIKSIAGDFADPRKQKALRDSFNFETTKDGGESLKSLSSILGDLFVAYQKMSSAERESMLFSVAGKQQASRMASLLDNYVRSQVLAITAQLNLSSAEQENAKIKETLHSQLIALSSEWERFANLQGNRAFGPSAALSQMTQLLTNLLKLANSSVGSGVITGMGVLLTAMTAKLAITGLSLESASKKGGLFKSTANAIRASMADLLGVMNAATKGRGGLIGMLNDVGRGAMAGSGFRTVMTAGPDGAATMVKVTKATADASKSMYAFGVATRFAAAGLAGLADFAIPLLLLSGVVWGVNAAMKEMGAVGGASAGKIDALDQKMQSAAAAAEAYAMAARLFENAQRAINEPGPQQGKITLLRQVAEAALPPVVGESEAEGEARHSKLEAYRAEFETLVRSNRVSEASLMLERLKTDAIVAQSRKRQEAYQFTQRKDAEILSRIAAIQNDGHDPMNVLSGGWSKKAKQQSVEELQGQLSTNADKRVQMLHEEMQANQASLQAFLEGDERHMAFLERQQEIVVSINDLYHQMAVTGKTQALDAEIQRLHVIESLHKSNLAALEKEKATRERAGENTEPQEALLAQANSKRSESDAALQSARKGFEKMYGRLPSEYRDEGGGVSRSKIEAAIRENYPNRGPERNSPFGKAQASFQRADELARQAQELEDKAAKEQVSGNPGSRLQGKIQAEQAALQKARATLDAKANITRYDKDEYPADAEDLKKKASDLRKSEARHRANVGLWNKEWSSTTTVDNKPVTKEFWDSVKEGEVKAHEKYAERDAKQSKELEGRASTPIHKVGDIKEDHGANAELERLAKLHDDRSIESRIAIATGNGLAVGDGEGQQLVNKRTGLENKLTQGGGTDTQQLEWRKSLQESYIDGELKIVELQTRLVNLTKERNREQQRGLLAGDSGSLLRKFSVATLIQKSGGKLNAGQFFSLSSAARQDILDSPGNSAQERDLGRDISNLKKGGYGGSTPVSTVKKLNDGQRGPVNALTGRLGPQVDVPAQDHAVASLNASAEKASISVGALAMAAMRAEMACEGLAKQLESLRGGGGNSGGARNPQNQMGPV